jgi:cytochrome P450
MAASRRPDRPRGSFLMGSARDLQRDQLETYERAMLEHDDIAHFRVGPPRIGFEFDTVFTPEGARQVLAADASHYEKGAPIFSEFEHVLGNGLLTSNGDRWRRHRRIVAPMFTRRRVAVHLDTINDSAADLVSWCGDQMAADGTVDLHATSTRYALHVLGTAIFGEDIVVAAPVLREALPQLGEHAARRGLAPVRSPHWWPSRANRRAAAHRRRLWELADELIAKRVAAEGDSTDLLGLLLEARDPETGEGLTPRDVRDEALIFLIAGHETTGSALAFTLQLVGRHPDVQERVRSEVRDADAADPTSPLGLDRLPYTTQVVNESLRLYPPAHTVVRSATDDTEVLRCPVERGGIVAVSIWGIHHRADLWPAPHEFSPDRFEADAEENKGAATRYSHIPFGGGPRSCIGDQLALTELVVAVAAVIRRFRVDALLPAPPTDVDIVLRPHGVLPARLEPVGP